MLDLSSYAYRKIARDALKGRWPGAVLAGLIAVWLGAFAVSLGSISEYVLVVSASMMVLEYIPGYLYIFAFLIVMIAIFYFFVGGVVRLGYIDYNLALLDRRKARLSLLTSHFSLWWKMVVAKITWACIMLPMTLLLVIPGICANYAYAMVPYIIKEKKDFTVDEAFRASRRIMRGHKWQLFCLRFSFIGWYIVGILTLGLGFLFIIPYRSAAEAAFYNEISGRADALYGRVTTDAYEEAEDEEEEYDE